MSRNPLPAFGVPQGGFALFLNDGAGGYVLRRPGITVHVVGEAQGPVYVTLDIDGPDTEGALVAAGYEADDLEAFRRRFQGMVALGHDGGPDEGPVDWDLDALWLASVPWVLDATPRG